MKDPKSRQQALYDSLASRIVVLDGAMGSILHSQLTVADYGGSHLENCTDNVCLTRPDLIAEIHEQYLAAGAQLIETNSFNGHPLSMAEFQLQDRAVEINLAAARIAREAADEYWTDAKPRFVAGSMGPTTRSITVTRNVTFEELREVITSRRRRCSRAAPTSCWSRPARIRATSRRRCSASKRPSRNWASRAPVMVSGTIEPMGTMLAGQTADAFYASIGHRNLLSIGLNCATGPEFMTDHIRTLHEMASYAHLLLSECGSAERREANTSRRRRRLAAQLEKFVDHGWLNIIGGCCGTTPAHIQAIAADGGRQEAAARSEQPARLTTAASNWWRRTKRTGR